MKSIILPKALLNASEFGGKINSNVVLGLVLKDNPSLKKDILKLKTEIELIAKEIEAMSLVEIQKKLKKISPELNTEKKIKAIDGPLKPLPDADLGKVMVRIAPSPSGPLHIGHAYGASLNYEYAKMYKGKFIVRIEDTNPENIYPLAYELIENDANWLTDKGVNQVIIQSSRLGIYYDYAEKLVTLDKAYVCTCNSDEWREKKNLAQACPCRNLKIKENQFRYAKMFNGYAEGEAVLRLKTDIQDKNPALRDFAILRINEHVHPKCGKEQRVWPLMVFSVAVDDHELGITHVLNGKDHADNAQKERIIMGFLGWKTPVYRHWGRINFEGYKLSTSKTRLAIEQGEYTGWDDIRLPFLAALRKRGYQPGAFRKYALEIGLSLNDKTVTLGEFWKNINSFNRELIETKANRYFFVDDPIKLEIEAAPIKEFKLDLHPDFPNRGQRKLSLKKGVYLAKTDFSNLDSGKVHRLMDAFNFKLDKGKFKFVSEDYEEYRNSEKKGVIVHWLPEGETVKVQVLMDTGVIIKGLGEKSMDKLNVGDIVQLERRFFAKLNKKEKDCLTFWYLHK